MSNNPLPIILIVLFLKNRGGGGIQAPVINTLELESFLDSARSLLNTIDRINGFAQSGLPSSLPDMKKIMEVVENLPL